jgi:Brp/Blh family beta-carotene 15,15'-monooxygenase
VLLRTGDVVPLAAVAAVLGCCLLSTDHASELGWISLTVAVVVGLPHGAVDHLVPTWLSARRASPSTVLAVAVGYAAVAGIVLVLFTVVPTATTLLFLTLSIWHFGTADAFYAEAHRPEPRPPSPVAAAAAAIVRGGVPVLLPLVRWPEAVRPVLDALAPGAADALLTDGVRSSVLVATLAAAGAVVAADLARRDARPAVELALLVALTLVAPPLTAFAVYFGAWHALRHVLRLLAEDPSNGPTLRDGRVAPALRRFAALAALPTLASLAVLAGLWLHSDDPTDFVAADLRLLAALTVPHMIVVAWLDHREPA